ncbi:2-oxoacid:ferredoxin oxidoreductase subunit beta [Fidelibacter multiformis]|jgi:2-oxoglutarate ferredoxin oxidoreductase subunit beta|uniref:2-oxoacid:ferredoxin oxidoreductase subunit beta n=1 Tax=Fidelibacter multiformis TaxID=3377529 RepID=UPI0037DD2E91
MDEVKYSLKDYKSDLKPIWCPGCGDYGVLNALMQAFVKLQIPPHQMALISGIGCSSRLPGYINTYGFNGIHGRAIPLATGVKLSNPDIKVIAVGGDGDGFSIGAGHIPHAARKNIDMTYIVMNNNIYGLTKGQASPTTPVGEQTKTTFYGNMDEPINPVRMMIAYKASFVARVFSGDPKNAIEVITQAIQHRGFSFVEVLSPCPTFRGVEQFKLIREKVRHLPEDYQPTDEVRAFDIANDNDFIRLGVIYRQDRPIYTDIMRKMQQVSEKMGKPEILNLLKQFEP